MSTNFAPDKRLPIRIDLGQIRPRQEVSRQALSSSVDGLCGTRPEPKTVDVKIGNTVYSYRYWKTKWTNKATRRVYTSYVLAYTDGLRPRRDKRASFKMLRARAEEIATAEANHETARLQLTPADQASYLRSRELLSPFGKALEVATGEHVDCLKLLSGRASVIEAVRDYLARHPQGVLPKNIPELATEFLAKRKMGVKWRRVLGKMIERFTEKFTGPFTSLLARDLEDWLDSLKNKRGKIVGLETRANYRAMVVGLVGFAKARGYLAKDWAVLEDVTNPEPGPVKVNIYTPRELVALLNFAESYPAGRKLVPFIAITAFAGVRHGEMNEEKVEYLDWKNIRFRTKRIVIGEEAKTKKRRIVDMPDNLVAWLQPYARTGGRICPLKNTSNALCRLRDRAAKSFLAEANRVANANRRIELQELAELLQGPKKNALRKSFISYKKALTGDIERVADQAGNSAKVIRENYLHMDEDMKEEAERWFAIQPERADVLPLFTWGKQA